MSAQQLATRAILVVGAVGYVVFFAQVSTFLAWLGRRGAGWVGIVVRTLVALVALLALLFGLSLAGNLGWTRHLSRPVMLTLAYATVGGMAAAPWLAAWALHRWRRAAQAREGGA